MTRNRFSSHPITPTLLLLCCIVLLVYLLTSSGTIFSIDGHRRFQVTQSLVEHGRVDITSPDLSLFGRGGRQYTPYAIGHSLLMVPSYLAGQAVAHLVPGREDEVIEFMVSLTNLFVTVLLVGFLSAFAWRLGFSIRTTLLVGFVFAFGTMAWQQSKDSFEHPQMALYFVLLFYFLVRFSDTGRLRNLGFAGCALGLALVTRYTALLAYPAIAMFFVGQARKSEWRVGFCKALTWFGVVTLVTLPFLGFDLWFNDLRFDSPFETGHRQLVDRLFAPETFFSGLWGLTLGWEVGLFPFNPLYFLSLVGVPLFLRKQKIPGIAFLTLIGSYLLVHASLAEGLWRGGWAWGPRYLMDMSPFLMMFCAPVLENLTRGPGRKTGWRVLVGVLVGLSLLVQVESVLVNYNRGFAKRELEIGDHSFRQTGFQESLLYLQAENILEITNNLWEGRSPTQERTQTFTTLSTLDDSLTFGSFQIWWVYALHLGVPRVWIFFYLAATAIGLGWAIWTLRNELRCETSMGPASD